MLEFFKRIDPEVAKKISVTPAVATRYDGRLIRTLSLRVQHNNLRILIPAQLLSTSAAVVMIAVCGVIGSDLAPTPALATLPASLMVVGTAAATLPAGHFMRLFGRRRVFTLNALVAAIALCGCALAVQRGNFVGFVGACALFGTTLAVTQHYRFAAAECVSEANTARAISWVLAASIGGALLGPELVTRASELFDVRFTGTLLVQAVLLACMAVALYLLFQNVVLDTGNDDAEAMVRPMREWATQYRYLLAVSAGVTGQGVMVLIMTATPISMHVMDGHSMADTASVIRAHVLAMYLPSFFTGSLITRFGVQRIMLAGLAIFVLSIAAGLLGHEYRHYWLALVALGVAWNFLFIGGTTLLTTTYRSSERFTAQSINDFSIFGFSALCSLLAGSLLHHVGWRMVLLAPIPILLVVGLMILLRRRLGD